MIDVENSPKNPAEGEAPVESVLAKKLKEGAAQESAPKAALPESYQRVVDTYDPVLNPVDIPQEARDVATNKERFDVVEGMEAAHMKTQARISGALRDAGDALVGQQIHEAMNRVRHARDEQQREAYQSELTGLVMKADDPLIAEKMLAIRDLQDLSDKYHDESAFKAVSDYYNQRGEFLIEAGEPEDVASATNPELKPFGAQTEVDDTAAFGAVTGEQPAFRGDLDVFEGGAAANSPEDKVPGSGVDVFADTSPDVSSYAPTAAMESVGKIGPTGKKMSSDLQDILNYGAKGTETLAMPGSMYKMQEEVIKIGQRVTAAVTEKMQAIAAREAEIAQANKQENAA